MKRTHNHLAALQFVVLATAMIVLAPTSAQTCRSEDGANRTSSAVSKATQQAARAAERKAALARIEKRLAQADEEAIAAVEQCLTSLRQLFSNARQGTRGFAKDALSFSSKWRLMVDYVPGTRGNRHATFMKEAFERHIFASEDLGRAIESAIAEFQRVQQDIENQALIDIGADLESLKLQPNAPPSKDALQKRVHSLLKDATRNVQGDLVSEVLVAMSSDAAQQLVRLVAIRMGVSSAILGTGASTSWATFGLSIAASALVDWIVTEIWDWWADPTGELAAKIDGQVNQLRHELLDGPQGLKQTLSAAATARNKLRQKAVLEAFSDWAK